MGREAAFLIYCIERYRYFKDLSGSEVAELFTKSGADRYILKYFEALHTMGDRAITEDIDAYIADAEKTIKQQ